MALLTFDRLRPLVLPTAFAAALLLTWQALVLIFGYPKVILPAPSDIFIALRDNFGMIWRQTVPTVRDTLAGFALAALFGVGLASLLSFSRLLRDAIYPLIVVVQLVPKIAWTPLFIVWVGIGWPSRLTIATFIGFFPIFIAMMAGLDTLSVRRPQDRRHAGRNRRHRGGVHLIVRRAGLPDPAKRRPAAHRHHPGRHHRSLPRGPRLLRCGACGRGGRAPVAR